MTFLKKVLFLPKWYPNKFDPQLGIFIRKHARAVAQHFQVAVLYIHPDPSCFQSYQFVFRKTDQVHEYIIYHPTSQSNNQLIRKAYHLYQYIRCSFIGWKKVHTSFGKPDMSHIHVMTRPSLLALFLQYFHQVPFFISEHWSGYINQQYAKQSSLKKAYTRWIFKQAKGASVVSKQLKQAMNDLLLAHVNYIIPNVVESVSCEVQSARCDDKTNPTIPHSHNPSFPQSLNHPITQSLNHSTIGMVADLRDDIKNITGVLHAIQEVSQTHNHFQLHIIGGGPDEAMLRQKAIDLGLQKLVVFHGRQDNTKVLPFLQQIDFLVLNSYHETFSVVAAEALAAGKPVISTKCGGPEAFLNEQTGKLIPVGDDQALATALLYMLDHHKEYDPELLKQKVSQKYGLKRIGEQFLEMYRKGLGFGEEIQD